MGSAISHEAEEEDGDVGAVDVGFVVDDGAAVAVNVEAERESATSHEVEVEGAGI